MNEIIKKNGIAFGIIIGIFSILVTTLIYTIDLNLFVNIWVGLTTIAIYIIIGVIVVAKTKKQLHGQITFKEAFTVYFIAAVIGGLLSTLFQIVLFNVIDPAAKETIKELGIKYTTETMERFNAPSASINETVEQMQSVDNYSPVSLLKGFAFGLIISAIFSALLGLIFRSKTDYTQ